MYTVSDAEWQVLEVLWQKETFVLGEVYSALRPNTGWSRNTVHTYLTRMERKGLVQIDRSIEPHRYAAGASRPDCERRERNVFLEKLYGGSTGNLIAAFLTESSISPEERDHLRNLLDDMKL